MRLLSRKDLIAKLLKSKKFRDAYAYEHIRNGIPFQLRAMREQREWTQAHLGEAAQKPRNVITRLENPNYGKLTLKTLFEIASGCNVALLVKFVPFSRLLKEYEDVSSEALYATDITDEEEIVRLEEWAAEEEEPETELAPAASGVVINAEHIFPNALTNTTATGMQFLPGIYPVEVSVSAPSEERRLTSKTPSETVAADTEIVMDGQIKTLKKAAGGT